MTERVVVHRGTYHDSAFLMRVARTLRDRDGIDEAVVLMGTEMNRQLLADAGFAASAAADATPLDLVVALRGVDDATLDRTEAALAGLLSGSAADAGGGGGAAAPPPRSVEQALERTAATPAGTVVSIAVPGEYAVHAAHRALDADCHVFLFSDNVSLDDEVALKRRGRDAGLLVMGPDCGTSILAGVRLGFANRVPRGPVGLVGPSGTGIQEIACGLAEDGIGVSHAIGTGSRDMKRAVGGAMTSMGIEALADDDGTEVIALVAKPPADEVAERVHEQLARCGKPAVVRYLGQPPRPDADGVRYAATLDDAVALAAWLARGGDGDPPTPDALAAPAELTGVGGRLIGLFGGGSLAAEAREILRRHGVAERAPGRDPWMPGEPLPDGGHLLIDVGDDVYTRGRPHPMVDPALRIQLLGEALRHPAVGVVLLDVMLGDGAHPDPAAALAEAVRAGVAAGPTPTMVIASVSGAPDDPQGTERQRSLLQDAGVVVRDSATRAAQWAALLLGGAPAGRRA